MVQSNLTGGSLHASRAAAQHGHPLAVPRPTPREAGTKESKVQATLMLLGPPSEVAALNSLVAMNTSEDYPAFVEALQSVGEPLSARLL